MCGVSSEVIISCPSTGAQNLNHLINKITGIWKSTWIFILWVEEQACVQRYTSSNHENFKIDTRWRCRLNLSERAWLVCLNKKECRRFHSRLDFLKNSILKIWRSESIAGKRYGRLKSEKFGYLVFSLFQCNGVYFLYAGFEPGTVRRLNRSAKEVLPWFLSHFKKILQAAKFLFCQCTNKVLTSNEKSVLPQNG